MSEAREAKAGRLPRSDMYCRYRFRVSNRCLANDHSKQPVRSDSAMAKVLFLIGLGQVKTTTFRLGLILKLKCSPYGPSRRQLAEFFPKIRTPRAGLGLGLGPTPLGNFGVVARLQNGRNLAALPKSRAGVLGIFQKTV